MTKFYSFASAVISQHVQKWTRIYRLKDLFFRLILEDISPFVKPLVPLFGLLITSALGFKALVDPLTCVLIGFISGVTPNEHLTASMAAEYLLPTYFITQLELVIQRLNNTYSWMKCSQIYSFLLPWYWPVVDLEARVPRAPLSSIFFIFMQFLAKIMPNNRLAPGGWRPLWEILDPPLLTNLLKFHGHSKLFFKHSMWESICNGNYEITIRAMLMCLTTKRTFLTNNIIKTKK